MIVHIHMRARREIKSNHLCVSHVQDSSSLSESRYHLETLASNCVSGSVWRREFQRGFAQTSADRFAAAITLAYYQQRGGGGAKGETCIMHVNPGRSRPRQLYARRPNAVSVRFTVAMAMNLAGDRHRYNAITQQRGDNVRGATNDRLRDRVNLHTLI